MGICSFSAYCVNTGLGTYSQFDGIYSAAGVYNTYLYYTGGTSPISYLYYFTSVTLDNRWCLSTSLSGSCILFGRTPCLSDCPDLDTSFFNSGICPTPTPTPTPQCQLDFSSIFDCNVIPTPTPTVTTTSTPTPTPTPTQTNPCPVYADVSINIIPPNPSPTPTPTPSTTPTGYCDNIIGVAYSNMLSGTIVCDQVNKYQLCQTSTSNPIYYYTSSGAYLNGSGATVGSYYTAYVDANSTITCLRYLGVVPNVGSESSITLIAGPYNDCTICFPTPTPTPSPTITPTITRTPTPTPTKTPQQQDFYIFRDCNRQTYIIQPAGIPTVLPSSISTHLNNVFQVNYKNNGNTITECYIYIGFYGGTLSTYPTTLVPAGSNVILSQTDYFSQLNLVSPGIPNIWFTSCNQCSSYRP
jgi:hypothetical protein